MGRNKVPNKRLMEMRNVYNSEGQTAVYELLRTEYGIKSPYQVMRRMKLSPEFNYDATSDSFNVDGEKTEENIFMSMDELCPPTMAEITSSKIEQTKSRSAAMDQMIQELIGDRLLEISKYVTMESISKKVLVDKSSLISDGYHLVIY